MVSDQSWNPYPMREGSTVTGTLLVSDPLDAPDLARSVELVAWLPDGYQGASDLPVLYMHDGHNLFDESASHAGEWQVDETMDALGLEAVVVGIANAGDDRPREYCPWPNHHTADVLGVEYAQFVIDSVVPFVEATLPVATERWGRGSMGSSLGGVISLYLYLTHPGMFGFVGSMSTAAWWTPRIWDFLHRVQAPPGRVYLDVGTDEMPTDPLMSLAYVDAFHRLRRWFAAAGDDVELLAIEAPGAIHHETAWARRFPTAAEFLFGRSER